MKTEGCSMFAVRFQHGCLSRGGRRRNLPPGNARAESFTLDTSSPRQTNVPGQGGIQDQTASKQFFSWTAHRLVNPRHPAALTLRNLNSQPLLL
jgi:hypothetical protein